MQRSNISGLHHLRPAPWYSLLLGAAMASGLFFWGPARAEDMPSGGNLLGQRGLLRSVAALNNPAGTIALGADLQYFSAGEFLRSRSGNAQDHSRMVNTYSITWTPLSFLEAALAMHVISDNSVDGKDEELQVAVGDPQIALKGSYRFGGGLAVAGLLDLRFPSGAGYFEPAGSAANLTFSVLGSWSGGNTLPLSLHLNVGFAIDGSKNLFADPATLTPAQRYAAQISSFNRLVTRLGVEYDTRYVGPFVELSLEPFMGNGAPGFGKSPGLLSLGARIWPTKKKGLQLLAALDVGLTGVGKGQPSSLAADKFAYVIPRWNLVFRLSYRFDPFAKPAVVMRHVRPREDGDTPRPETKKLGTISGKVVDGRTGSPIWNARVKLDGSTISQLAVDPKTGEFRTFPLKAGSQVVSAAADGYQPGSVTVKVEADANVETTVKLMPRTAITPGTLRGSVRAMGGKNVKSATVLIPELDQTLTVGEGGAFTVQLKPGVYKIVVSARGYRTQRKKIRVLEGSTVILNVELHRGRRR